MMKLSDFCLLSAVAAALVGMGAGIFMGVTQDFSLAPAHAHLNLLGWVTTALFGLYYRGTVPRDRLLARIQVAASVAGFWMMPTGLALYLGLGDHRFVVLVTAGALLSLAGMALFAAVVVRTLPGRDRAVPLSRTRPA